MKKLIAVLLCVCASLLTVRVWQEMPMARGQAVATKNGDIDGDGVRDISDAVSLLNWLFQGGDAPPDPGAKECGPDPTDDDLGCENPPEDCL